MSYNFLPYNQDQQFLLPPDLQDWVEEDSLERFVSDVVDHLDAESRLEPFYERYREDRWGHPAYHPVLLVKVLVYGYAIGVRSSRKLARLLERDVAFRYLAANQQPDFRTISDFRKEHREAFEELFEEILLLCREAGLADLERVALDGRRVQGDASLEQNRTREQIREEIEEILEEAEEVDAEEDEEYGEDARGDELPEDLREEKDRLRKLKEAQERLDAEEEQMRAEQAEKIRRRKAEERETGKKKRGRKPKPPEEVELPEDRKVDLTDPESEILKTRRGWVQGYNGQVMVDCESQVIVAQNVVAEAADVGQLGPMLDRCEAGIGERPDQLLADAGYWSEENAELEDDRTELFISTTKDWKRRKELREQGSPRGRIPDSYGLKRLMERKLRTKRRRGIYKERSTSVEPVFGQMVNRAG